MNYEVIVAATARRDLQRIPPRIVPAIIEFVFGDLAKTPRRVGKPLRGELEGSYSARRGPYRVLYKINDPAEPGRDPASRPPSRRLPQQLIGSLEPDRDGTFAVSDGDLPGDLGALRLTVRDKSTGLPHQLHRDLQTHGRGLTIVTGLSREIGVLPTAGNTARPAHAVLTKPPQPGSCSPEQ